MKGLHKRAGSVYNKPKDNRRKAEDETVKHLLKLMDCTPEEILGILDLADRLKAERKAGIAHPLLAGKTGHDF